MDTDYRGKAASFQEDVQPQAADSYPDPETDMEALLRDSDYGFRRLHRGESVEGTVVRVDQDEVLVDIGLKSEGVIPARELFGEGEQPPDLHVGDRILVVVVHPEGSEGHAILSLRRARVERSWREIEELYQQGAIAEAPVVDFNKGGLIVDVRGVRGFVPVSQVLDLRNVARQEGDNEEVANALAGMVGRSLPLKIIEINRHRNRLILSERAAVQERRTQRKDELMDTLQPGQIRHGVVSNVTSFGAFVDLGGADGLVHVSELSYNRVNHPNEVLQVGQEVDVMVLSVDRDTKKIALSLKRALPDPWTTVEQDYRVGQVVTATITKLAKFGAFAKVQEGLEGLIHTSELTDRPVQDPAQVVQEGQVLPVKIIHINSQRRRLGLSARQAAEPYGYATESFGQVDPNTPFDTPELASYQDETYPEPETAEADVPVDEAPTGEQESPAAEFEPQESDGESTAPEAAAPEEASPASAEETSFDEEQQAEVASATGKPSVSE
jgi:small subunit ribosomal protein S1